MHGVILVNIRFQVEHTPSSFAGDRYVVRSAVGCLYRHRQLLAIGHVAVCVCTGVDVSSVARLIKMRFIIHWTPPTVTCLHSIGQHVSTEHVPRHTFQHEHCNFKTPDVVWNFVCMQIHSHSHHVSILLVNTCTLHEHVPCHMDL